ncbi:MAG: endopeptidase La [Planctomycetota bacterium]
MEANDAPPSNLFILPHENMVVFPELVAPVVLKGPLAIRTIEQADTQTKYVGCVLARPEWDGEQLSASDVHTVGCAARVIRTLKLPDDSTSVVLRGLKRFRIQRFLRTRPYLIARVEYLEETKAHTDESEAMMRVLRGLLRKVLTSDDAVPDEFKLAASNIESPRALADFAATYFVRSQESRQELLATFDVQHRLEQIITILTREVGLLELGQRIQERIRSRLEEQQRDFFLREQLKEIRKELGEAKDEKAVAIERLEERLSGIELPEVAAKRVTEEMERLKLLPLESPESGVVRNYLEWIASLPWDVTTEDRADLDLAEKLLRESHFGLDEVKERVVEFLAVRQLKPDHRGPILCFVGPPGVGKTSLGHAIADSLGRKFVRISLGGIRDEAEIRGHRRTYVGAMPGRVLQGLKTAASRNPVFMLDELDKLGVDFRGDPSSALLEALDPEQNSGFSDHFLELPFDLSRVMFVATANTLTTVPPALLDRLEIIELPGYTAREKVGIAEKYLLPRQIERHGLKPKSITFSRPALREIQQLYTREAGVRNLEQMLARICRKHATRTARGRARKLKIEPANLQRFLGVPRFSGQRAMRMDRPGIATGLAWTPVGGEALSVEVGLVNGTGKLNLTGKLGDVMLESAKIALSHVRSLSSDYGFDSPDLSKLDIHIHVPGGAVPKDGPSAGITLATALVSIFRRRRVTARLAMTGELTLTGKVLAVGGLRDKILAARRAGMRKVILPLENQPQIEELTTDARAGLDFHFVSDFAEVVEIAFPGPRTTTGHRRKRQ